MKYQEKTSYTQPFWGLAKSKGLADVNVMTPSKADPAISLSLSENAKLFWRRRWFFCALLLAGLIHGIVAVHVAEPQYEANMAIAANNQQIKLGMGTGLGASGSALGSLVGLAGGDIEQLTPFQQYRFLIESQSMADVLARRHGALQLVFQNVWNSETKTWQRPPSVFNPLKDMIKSILGLKVWAPPTSKDLHDFLNANMRISPEGIGGVYRVSLRFRDPKIALALLSYINTDTNRIITDEELKRTSAEIKLLQEQLNQVNQMDTRTALTQVLADHLETQTVLKADLSYSARVLEAPSVQDTPVSPVPLLLIAVTIAAYGALGVVLVLVEKAWQLRQKKSAPQPI